MEKTTASSILQQWGAEGRQSIPQNLELFNELVAKARSFLDRGEYTMAAIYSEIAASHAVAKHCGLFASLELEDILLEVGRKSISKNFAPDKDKTFANTQKRILHVASSVMGIGGLSKMLWNWIEQDSENSHSLALTQQSPNHRVPERLKSAIFNRSGHIYILSENFGNLISWAKELRKISSSADLVILHIHNNDVIPMIAFADKNQSPPILLLDHADHMFWLGARISDIVISLRDSGMQLAQKRRSIEAQRNILLPIILEPIQRSISRTEAKKQIGVPASSILILSVARAVKYKTINGLSFADAHVQLLEKYKQAILIVIGPGEHPDWIAAIQQCQGRLRALSETEETAVFFQAADIYVDSFPFSSNTSLLEAGSYSLPLVSRFPYSSEDCKILGTDMPGLNENIIEVKDIKEYTKILSKLIESEDFRTSLGEKTRKKIAETHTGKEWKRFLCNVYYRAESLPKVSQSTIVTDQAVIDEPDIFISSIYGWNVNVDHYISFMPLIPRLNHWIRLDRRYNLRQRIVLLLPPWLNTRYVQLKAIFNGSLK